MWHRHDTEYVQPSDNQILSNMQNNLTKTKPTQPTKRSKFLTDHEDEIWAKEREGIGSKGISEFLCQKYKVGKNQCTPKKVTNWIQYRKSARKGRTHPVSLQNRNLGVNYKDQRNCMNIRCDYNINI
jgi:hypothetical protein